MHQRTDITLWFIWWLVSGAVFRLYPLSSSLYKQQTQSGRWDATNRVLGGNSDKKKEKSLCVSIYNAKCRRRIASILILFIFRCFCFLVWETTTMKSGDEPFYKSRDFMMSKWINFNKECFLYSFSFKEDCYLVACKYASCAPKIDIVFQACSIISSKRMIDRMRHQNYYEIVYSESD